jgi:hypothetical protein
VCPAYQSVFYLDKEKTEDFFSLFGEDTLPKSDVFVNKNKYGIIVKVKYRKKQESMKTIKMETVFPPGEDSLLLAEDNAVAELDSSSVDSLFTDSYKEKFKFNRDQKLYMLAMDPYFEYENLDEVPPVDAGPPQEEEQKEEKKKKSWWPFGKKNKAKNELDEEAQADGNQEEEEKLEEENQETEEIEETESEEETQEEENNNQ